ncbi:MAG TPA: hypothetical protein VIL74_09140 [Pyrinomonadaceae bacterium]|jgi:hypothetical protein
MKINTDKISAIMAIVAALGLFFSCFATVFEQISPKYGLIAMALSGSLSAFTKSLPSVLKQIGIEPDDAKKLLVVFALSALVLNSTACDARDLAKAKEQSARLAKYTNAGVDATRELYRAKMITLAQKDKIADGFIKLAEAGQAFEKTLSAIERQYGTNAPPQSEIDRLFNVFDREVVDQFLELLKELRVTVRSERVAEIIGILRTVVITTAKLFNKRAPVEQKLAAAGA